jgi:hypothetical protein
MSPLCAPPHQAFHGAKSSPAQLPLCASKTSLKSKNTAVSEQRHPLNAMSKWRSLTPNAPVKSNSPLNSRSKISSTIESAQLNSSANKASARRKLSLKSSSIAQKQNSRKNAIPPRKSSTKLAKKQSKHKSHMIALKVT